jgi:hypothetical protein
MRNPSAIFFTLALLAFLIGTAGAAIFPDLAQLASPIVCDGTLKTTTWSTTGGHKTSIACVDVRGQSAPLNAGFVGLVLSVEFFLPFAAIAIGWLALRRAPRVELSDDSDRG